ncbi:MAG: glycosyl hydrolase [Promethearchaeota archaeon]
MAEIDPSEFKNPPKSARPLVRWWWTGLDVEKEELLKELAELDNAGFYGAEIQAFMIGSPRKINKERANRTHRFMQPYYHEMIKALLQEASKRGMIIDLTIGSAWPVGGTHISKDKALKVLLIGEKTIKGPKLYRGKIPKFKKPLFYWLQPFFKIVIGTKLAEFYKKDMKLEALIAAQPVGKKGKIKYRKAKTAYLKKDSLINLTKLVDDKGYFEWEVPEGKWQIFAFYKGPSGSNPLGDCRSSPEGKSLVLDHLSAEAIKYHLDAHFGTGKKYYGEYFGKSLRAFFTDSLELSSDWLWSDDFLDQFYKRRGYDLMPFLPTCFVPNRDNKYLHVFFGVSPPAFDFKGTDIGERIRYDYERTISDLFTEEFVETMKKWADENNLKSRIQAYGIRVDTLKAYGRAHVPETEQLYGGGVIDFLKLAGSAGIIHESPIVTAESIVWNQRDYMTTPLKWKVAADRLFISGINQMIYHGFPYQHPSFPYPGYCAFSTPYVPRLMNFSSNFSRMNPFWEFFPQINQYITRCQLILQRGKTVVDVAIYYPILNYPDQVLKNEELVGGYLDENDAPKAKNQIDAHVKKKEKWDAEENWTHSLQLLGDDLVLNGYYYVHTNEESLINAIIEGNKMKIGGATVNVLILMSISSISLELANKLVEIANKGVFILFMNSIPTKQPGFLNYEENDIKIASMMKELLKRSNVHLIKEESRVSEYLRDDLKILPQIIHDPPQTPIQFIHKKMDNTDYYFLRNSINKSIKLSTLFTKQEHVPFLLDPWTGNIIKAAQYESNELGVRMDLFFAPYGSILIEFKKAEESLHALQSPIKILRNNDQLIGIIEKSGNYEIKLSNGTSKKIKLKEELPVPLELKTWHLFTNLRNMNGTFTPVELDLNSLIDWRKIEPLKYCSSKGTYTTTFELPTDFFRENYHFYLSINRVHDVARIFVNDQEVETLLSYPHEVDITNALKKGKNTLKIEVIPTLRNRLTGYAKKGGTSWKNHKKKSLMPAGLIGPVLIQTRFHHPL